MDPPGGRAGSAKLLALHHTAGHLNAFRQVRHGGLLEEPSEWHLHLKDVAHAGLTRVARREWPPSSKKLS